MSVKDFSKPTSKNREIGRFNRFFFANRVVLADLEVSLINSIWYGKYMPNLRIQQDTATDFQR